MSDTDNWNYPTLWSCVWYKEGKTFYSKQEIAEHIEQYLEEYHLESKFRWWLFWECLRVRDFIGTLDSIRKGHSPLKGLDTDEEWGFWEYLFVFAIRNPIIRLWWRIRDFVKYKILRMEYVDPHLGCYSYPNCDEDPLGCRHVMGDDVEQYGHRD
jgi:hypothetical protein